MRQLTQKLKTGSMKIKEVPIPHIQNKHIIVRNHFSLISTGTEASSVMTARKGYIGKAKEKPQQVKKVFDTLKSQGPVNTYRAVMKKLDAYSPLGYSCAGEVIDVAGDVNEYRVGDLVACGGFSASHAEFVCVPVNLCAKLQTNAKLKEAAYNTMGAIALQGVRQADLRVGEICCIIGMGLLGQLTAKILKASGVQVIGIDIDPKMIEIGKKHCLDLAFQRDEIGSENKIYEFTERLGCDAVIITAASSSLDPINFAGAISRKKGVIVVVGAVPTGFDREPYFYKKELQVKMSCSYGPGRYDPVYEEKCIDYPPAYVRWTEKRNMQAFQHLVYTGQVDVGYLTTHVFKLDKAPDAYEMIMNKSEPFIGILIEYDTEKKLQNKKVFITHSKTTAPLEDINIGFLGAGSYAQSHLLPNFPKGNSVKLKGVMTASGTSSRSVAERFGFEFCTGDADDILLNDDVNTIFIATRHDSHGDYVLRALKSGKHVFVEKPLCINPEELEAISEFYQNEASSTNTHSLLMVGYNRRFSPLTVKMKKCFASGKMAMIYRVNAGAIPAESWIQDSETGGGRIIGEVCHFIDYLTFINGSLPVSVYATAAPDSNGFNDILNVSLSYENGSIGSICYYSNGDKSLVKERIEIFSNGCSAVLEDFRTLTVFNKGKKKTTKLISQDKGQKGEVNAFVQTILNGKSSPIPYEEIHNTSLVTFKIHESLKNAEKVDV